MDPRFPRWELSVKSGIPQRYTYVTIVRRHGIEATFSLTTMSSTSESTPTLKSLQDYTSRQEERIESLMESPSEDYYLQETREETWKQLYYSAWGADLGSLDKSEPVVRAPDAINNALILPDIVPINRNVMPKPHNLDDCWRFECEKFLIRSEYKEAEGFVLSNFDPEQKVSNVVITGQPGIGPPLFYSVITGS